MGRVYEAADETLGRAVAIKVIRPELAGDAGFRARFKREATAVAQLHHRNVIAIHSFGEEDGLLFIVMPFVGTDLGSLLRERGRLDTAEAIEIVRQIARALDAAHAAGIVHRDVKPANVLVQGEPPDADVFLTDFGLTSAFAARSDETLSGAILGTLDYMAPEVLTGALPGRHGDVYALGVVLYELLTGRVPFAGEDREARVAAAQRGNRSPPPASDVVAGVPPELDAVIARALHSDPSERYASAGELAHAAAQAAGVATREVRVRHAATGDDLYFISHSQRDGREFAQRLAHALRSGPDPPAVWLEDEEIEPGQPDGGRKVVAAIKRSRGLLFVLTRDSARPGSSCQDDWERAIKLGKPVVPIGVHDDAELPFELGSRAVIDFGEDFDAGVRRLRRRLAAASSGEGRLRELRHRLADLERERRFAEPADHPRLDRTIAEVEQAIARLAGELGADAEPPRRATPSEPEPPPRPPRRSRARAAVAGCGVLAALAVAFVLGREWSSPAAPAAPDRDVIVDFSYSLGHPKVALLGPLIEQFNRERHMIGGRAVHVIVENERTSGDEVRLIAARRITPVAWSPADVSWGARLNFDLAQRGVRPWVVAEPYVLMSSATTIAMWRSGVDALGGPGAPLGWDDVLKLATDGWSKVKRRDLGPFKFAHPSPETSTTGLQATVNEYQFAAGERRRLQLSDVDGPAERSKVRAIERSIWHYGESAVDTEKRLAAEGSKYASAVALGEVSVLAVNRERERLRLPGRLVAIYPKEGMFLREEPFYVIDAPWVDANERRGAQMLESYLKAKITPEVAMAHDFRPGDRNAERPRKYVERWRELGVDIDPDARLLTMPEPPVLDAIEKAWQADRKPARVQIVLDTSTGMAGRRLNRAKRGLRQLLAELAPQDKVGLITGEPEQAVGLRRPRPGDTLLTRIDGLQASGEPVLYDAILDAVDSLAKPRRNNTIDAVLVLASGEAKDSATTYEQLHARLEGEQQARHPVRVFTIVYAPDDGSKPGGAAARLAALAAASGGQSFVAGERSVADVFRAIAPSY